AFDQLKSLIDSAEKTGVEAPANSHSKTVPLQARDSATIALRQMSQEKRYELQDKIDKTLEGNKKMANDASNKNVLKGKTKNELQEQVNTLYIERHRSRTSPENRKRALDGIVEIGLKADLLHKLNASSDGF
ncbi:MAG: hypothetical protein AAF621_06945, partial [Pseudomonadota bacterium]